MKILIITCLKSFSSGTFLQAYGLQKGLMDTFQQVHICFFLDITMFVIVKVNISNYYCLNNKMSLPNEIASLQKVSSIK